MTPPSPDSTRQKRPSALLTVTPAAQQAGVTRSTVSSWITRGKLPAVRINGRRYVRPDDLAATQARAHLGDGGAGVAAEPHRAGKRLRALREAAGMNQIQLAAASGLTHEAISRLETGNNAPYAETVRKLARALQRGAGAVRHPRQDHRADADDGGRGRLPVGRAAGPGPVLAAQGTGRGDEGLGRVAGAVGGDRRAGPQRAAARSFRPPRPALPGLRSVLGAGDSGDSVPGRTPHGRPDARSPSPADPITPQDAARAGPATREVACCRGSGLALLPLFLHFHLDVE